MTLSTQKEVHFLVNIIVARKQGKEKAKSLPSWALGNKLYVGENGKYFAKCLCDDYFGEGIYATKEFKTNEWWQKLMN